LDRSSAELEVRAMLSDAQSLIDADQIQEAQALVTAAGDTRAFTRELSVMQARLATARAAGIERTRAEREARREEVAALYTEGRAALGARRLKVAAAALQKGVAL